MDKRDFILRDNDCFLKKGWRNKNFKHRPPSVPPHRIPFSNKETLYELIREQNSQEAIKIESFSKKIMENLPKSSEHIKPHSGKIKRLRLKPKNIDIELENLSKSQDQKQSDEKEEQKFLVLKEPPNLSYRDRIQGIESEIIKEKNLEKSLRKLRISRTDTTDLLINKARIRETQRVQQILEGLRLKTEENQKFHNEIRERFDKYGQIRLELDKNFAVFTETLAIRNIEFFKDFSSLYKNKQSCPHKNIATKPIPSQNNLKKQEKSNSVHEEHLDIFFTVRTHKVDSHKTRVVLTLDKNQEVSFVTAENTENFIKFNTKKPEFEYFGNDAHDKSLLLELEKKLLSDLKHQHQQTQSLLKKSDLTQTIRPPTPTFSHQERPVSILLSLSEERKDPQWDCDICLSINNGFSKVFNEVFKRDRNIEQDFRALDEIFEEFSKEGISHEDMIVQMAQRFRNVVGSCFRILPNHAFFFEKCFKVMAFLQESLGMKNQATVAQLLGELRR